MLTLIVSVSCKSIEPGTTSTESSKLKIVTDQKYLLKLSEQLGGSGEETQYYFEVCYRNGSGCVDALQFVNVNSESGTTRIPFIKDDLSYARRVAVLRDFDELIQDPDKAAVLATATAGGVAVARSAKPSVFNIAPHDSLRGLRYIVDKMVDKSFFNSVQTIDTVKRWTRYQIEAMEAFGLNMESTPMGFLGSNTQEQVKSRISRLQGQKKGHIFSSDFEAFVKRQASQELESLGLRAKDVLAFEAKNFELSKYIKLFLESKAVEYQKAFDIRMILDPAIADDYLLYADLHHLLEASTPIVTTPRYAAYTDLRKKYVQDYSITINLNSYRTNAFSKFSKNIENFYKNGITKPIVEKLNYTSSVYLHKIHLWNPRFDKMTVVQLQEQLKSKNALQFLKDLMSSRFGAVITVAAAATGGVMIVLGMERGNPPENILGTYPSLADPSITSSETTDDIPSVLADLAQLLDLTYILAPFLICTPDKCSAVNQRD